MYVQQYGMACKNLMEDSIQVIGNVDLKYPAELMQMNILSTCTLVLCCVEI